jgi:hypothetical protein
MQDLPPAGAPLVFGTLADAVQRSGAGVAAAVQSGNVQLATTAEHLELSLVRCGTASRPARCAAGECRGTTLPCAVLTPSRARAACCRSRSPRESARRRCCRSSRCEHRVWRLARTPALPAGRF